MISKIFALINAIKDAALTAGRMNVKASAFALVWSWRKVLWLTIVSAITLMAAIGYYHWMGGDANGLIWTPRVLILLSGILLYWTYRAFSNITKAVTSELKLLVGDKTVDDLQREINVVVENLRTIGKDVGGSFLLLFFYPSMFALVALGVGHLATHAIKRTDAWWWFYPKLIGVVFFCLLAALFVFNDVLWPQTAGIRNAVNDGYNWMRGIEHTKELESLGELAEAESAERKRRNQVEARDRYYEVLGLETRNRGSDEKGAWLNIPVGGGGGYNPTVWLDQGDCVLLDGRDLTAIGGPLPKEQVITIATKGRHGYYGTSTSDVGIIAMRLVKEGCSKHATQVAEASPPPPVTQTVASQATRSGSPSVKSFNSTLNELGRTVYLYTLNDQGLDRPMMEIGPGNGIKNQPFRGIRRWWIQDGRGNVLWERTLNPFKDEPFTIPLDGTLLQGGNSGS